MSTIYYDESKSSSYSMAKVFGWMFYAILLTAVTSIGVPFILATTGNENLYFTLLIVGLVGVFILSFVTQFVIASSKSKGVAITVFSLFAICMGLWISPVILFSDVNTISVALLTTSVVFGVMALYGMVTKRDLSGFGSFLIMLLLGSLIISIFNIFIASYAVDWIVSYVILAVYIGFIAFDIQRVKRLAASGNLNTNIALLMALNLYIDFVYIFIRIVSIIQRNRN